MIMSLCLLKRVSQILKPAEKKAKYPYGNRNITPPRGAKGKKKPEGRMA